MAKLTIAVGGGKGGVGKSVIAANLAISLAQKGLRTVLVDADLGGANLHTMFGLESPSHLMEHFVSRRISALQETVVESGHPGLGLVCGGMPMAGTANPNHAQKSRLIRHILSLDGEAIVLDIGSGVGLTVLDLFNAAEFRLVVFTPQLTSLHNGYGFLKASIHRWMQQMVEPTLRDPLNAGGPEIGAESLHDVIQRLSVIDPREAMRLRAHLSQLWVFLVGNMVQAPPEQQIFKSLKDMIADHLLIRTEVLGVLRAGEKIHRSVNERRPFMATAGIEGNAETFRSMVDGLLRAWSERRKRRSVRLPLHLPVVLQVNQDHYPGGLCSISHNGALLEFPRSILGQPARGELLIGPNSHGRVIAVQVEIRHRAGLGKQMGVAFMDADPLVQEAIAGLLVGTSDSHNSPFSTSPPS